MIFTELFGGFAACCCVLAVIMYRLSRSRTRLLKAETLASAALRESEERFRMLIEDVREYAIFSLDGEGAIRSWNMGSARLTGFSAHEVLGRALSLFLSSEADELRRQSTSSERAAGEVRGTRKDGTEFLAHVTITAQNDPLGDRDGFSVILHDVTGQRAAQESLERSERTLREAEEITNLGHWVWDVKTDAVQCSPRMTAMLGMDASGAPVPFARLIETIHPERRAEAAAYLRNAARSESEYTGTFRLVEGLSAEWVHSRGRVYRDEGGEAIRVFGATVDVTLQKRAELELMRSHDLLETSIAERTQDLARANFELRTSEARFRVMADATPVIVWSSGPAGAFDYVNRQFTEYVSAEGDTPPQEAWCNAVHPEERQRWLEGWCGAAQSGQQWEGEFRIRRGGDGQYRWHLGRIVPTVGACSSVQRWFAVWTDIDDRKSEQTAMAKAHCILEQRVNAIVENIQEVIFQIDGTGRWTFLNPAWETLTGFTVEETMNRSPLDYFHHSYRGTCARAFEDLQTGREDSIRVELQGCCRDGGYRWFELLAKPALGEDGIAGGVAGAINDIHGRKLAENERSLQRELTVALGQIQAVLSTNAPEEALSRVAELLLQTIHATEITLWLAEPDASAWRCQGFAGESSRGTVRHVVLLAGADSVEGCIVVRNEEPLGPALLEAITEAATKISRELARRRSEERFQLLFDLSAEPHFLASEAGIVDCNEAALKMLGVSAEAEILGRHPASFAPEFQPDGEPSAAKIERIENLARQFGPQRFDWTYRREDGACFPMEVILTPLTLAGKLEWLSVWHDLTHQKQYEETLKAARLDAERASRAKSEFLAAVSEEIRKPLHGLLTVGRALMNTNLAPDQREYANEIASSGQELLAVVNGILDLSKMEAGHLRLDRTPFDLRLAAEDAIDLLAGKADQKGLDLVLRYSPDLPRRAVGDSGRVRQMLISLLENAVAFTNSGYITLELGGGPLAGNRLLITGKVQDSGIGIPPERLQILFQQFGSGRGAAGGSKGRTGLGLAIVYNLVGLMEGEIQVASDPGQGTTVTFSIHLGLDESEWPARKPPESLAGRSVLILDRSEVIRESLQAVLQIWNFRVLAEADPLRAIEAIRAAHAAGDPFWCTLISTEIAGMDWETFARLSGEVDLAAEPLRVLLARSTNMPTRSEARAAGYQSVVPRNVRHLKLLDVLLELAGERPASVSRNAAGGARGSSPQRVLLAVSDHTQRQQIQAWLTPLQYRHDCADTAAELLSKLAESAYNAVLVGGTFPFAAEDMARIAARCREKQTALLSVLADDQSGARETVGGPGDGPLPISMIALRRALAAWASAVRKPEEASFDQDKVLALCGGDFEMFSQLAADLRDTATLSLEQLTETTGKQDMAMSQIYTRRIRRNAQFFCAPALEGAATRLEETVGLLDWASAPAGISAVRLELNRLFSQLPQIVHPGIRLNDEARRTELV